MIFNPVTMMHFRFSFLLLGLGLVVSAAGCDRVNPQQTTSVRTGARVLIDDHLTELEGLKVGLVMNPTARIGETHMLDTLLALNVEVSALFAPEHGFRGDSGAGEVIEDGVDLRTGLPVFSLYGDSRKPAPDMFDDIDLLIFDMQDVGARFYTYISTLGLVLEAAGENGVPVWLLDRPNPAGGDYVSGWIMKEEFASFVGMYPIPVAHGMTLGELGSMIIGENWIDTDPAPQLRIIEMEGWRRQMKWPDTGLVWIPPSPNLPTFEHAFAYLGTCFTEGTTLSEGRGTPDPFLLLGSPRTEFSPADLNQLGEKLPGANIMKVSFTPESIPGRAMNPKHEGERSAGVKITVTDYDLYDPVESGLHILAFLINHTEDVEILPYIYQLAGDEEVLQIFEQNPDSIQFDTAAFREQRLPYLIYE